MFVWTVQVANALKRGNEAILYLLKQRRRRAHKACGCITDDGCGQLNDPCITTSQTLCIWNHMETLQNIAYLAIAIPVMVSFSILFRCSPLHHRSSSRIRTRFKFCASLSTDLPSAGGCVRDGIDGTSHTIPPSSTILSIPLFFLKALMMVGHNPAFPNRMHHVHLPVDVHLFNVCLFQGQHMATPHPSKLSISAKTPIFLSNSGDRDRENK